MALRYFYRDTLQYLHVTATTGVPTATTDVKVSRYKNVLLCIEIASDGSVYCVCVSFDNFLPIMKQELYFPDQAKYNSRYAVRTPDSWSG